MSVKMKPINFLALVALAMTSPFVVAQEGIAVILVFALFWKHQFVFSKLDGMLDFWLFQ